MIDTHCHLTYDGLVERVDDVVAEARAAGVDRMISVSTTPADARRAIGLARRFEGVYATAGIHPHHAAEAPDVAVLAGLLDDPAVVAIGEMGLDDHHADPPRAVQEGVFAAQLDLMREVGRLPGIIHNREATADTLALIRASGVQADRLVFHCFTGSVAEVDAILDAGAMVSFTGIVTFSNAGAIAEASDRVPMDRLMIETDSPFLAPEPHRRVRPNRPGLLVHVAGFLAGRRGYDLIDFAAHMDANAEVFFGLA